MEEEEEEGEGYIRGEECGVYTYQEEDGGQTAHPLNEEVEIHILVSEVILVVVVFGEEDESIGVQHSTSNHQLKSYQEVGLKRGSSQGQTKYTFITQLVLLLKYIVWEEGGGGYKNASEPSTDEEVQEHVDKEDRTGHNEAPVWKVVDISPVVFECTILILL